MDVETLQESVAGFFPDTLGIRFEEADRERIVASLEITDALCTVPGVAHGGALMAFADTLGAVGTVLNLPAGASTTTIESKTNFLAAARAGERIRGEATPLKIGRRVMTWQTRITDASGRLLAFVTQTQMVLEGPTKPTE